MRFLAPRTKPTMEAKVRDSKVDLCDQLDRIRKVSVLLEPECSCSLSPEEVVLLESFNLRCVGKQISQWRLPLCPAWFQAQCSETMVEGVRSISLPNELLNEGELLDKRPPWVGRAWSLSIHCIALSLQVLRAGAGKSTSSTDRRHE